ncbi:hypothetical protein J6590_000722 [Homalodisca vitripennis]|nr:hypothetical protein J6590_000722 [Homalodisca vitripennis]
MSVTTKTPPVLLSHFLAKRLFAESGKHLSKAGESLFGVKLSQWLNALFPEQQLTGHPGSNFISYQNNCQTASSPSTFPSSHLIYHELCLTCLLLHQVPIIPQSLPFLVLTRSKLTPWLFRRPHQCSRILATLFYRVSPTDSAYQDSAPKHSINLEQNWSFRSSVHSRNFDIACVTENWLSKNNFIALSVQGYLVAGGFCRSDRSRGGVFALVIYTVLVTSHHLSRSSPPLAVGTAVRGV